MVSQVKELSVLGFSEAGRCGEALRLSGGEVRGALAVLQRPLLEPFHQRMWSDQPEPPINIHLPDKQVGFTLQENADGSEPRSSPSVHFKQLYQN